jgi:hypothetical protein
MRPKRVSAALAVTTLAVAALAGCGQAHVTPSAPKPAATATASVTACVAALEKLGMTAIATDVGTAFPAAVNRACDGLSATGMNAAVNTAMSHLMNTSS